MRKLKDELLTRRNSITRLYLIVAGLLSLLYGFSFLQFASFWILSLQSIFFVILLIALVTIVIIGVIVMFLESHPKGMSRLTLGCMIFNFIVMLLLSIHLSLQEQYFSSIYKKNMFFDSLLALIRGSQVGGLILLGTWLFPLIGLLGIRILGRYRRTEI
ncbi:MAG: hypothetical protein ACXAC8_11540 [Candidatus Hodarchaeales archaeon]|jgi:hypothetical protein